MEFLSDVFSDTQLLLAWIIVAVFIMNALRWAPWKRFERSEQQHVFLGSCLAMTLLWSMQANVNDSLDFHLLAMTTFTLMFGWSLALLGSAVVVAAATLVGNAEFATYPVNYIVSGIMPASFTWLAWRLTQRYLPRHFFIYIFINAFFVGGFVAMLCGFSVAFLLSYTGSVSTEVLDMHYIPYFPLMFFPEAVLNGWLTTMLVSLRPEWISTFDDDLYINGK